RAQHARPVRARKLFDVALGLRVEVDAAEAAVAHADEQRADVGVENVEGDVEQALGGCRGAEALVELGGEGRSHCCSFRRRRTPADAACRAADPVEPSASPISSYS